MPSNASISLWAGVLVIVGGLGTSLSAQTLGDVARKEEERRKAVPAGKVYTNKDLGAVPAPSSEAAANDSEKDGGARTSSDTGKGSDKPEANSPKTGDKSGDKGDKDKKDAAAGGGVRDQKYWRDRMNTARVALERDTGYADAMQTRINALTTDFTNRDDPSQRSAIERDRQKALSALDRLRKQIEDDKKAISELEEEARRAGVPPGWLR
jgi:hypothetical protein